MQINRTSRIQELLADSGLDWLFPGPEGEQRAQALAQEFDEVEGFYRKRYDPEFDLLGTVAANPEKYRPFLHSIGLPMSAEIRTVILRLIEGHEILDLDFAYHRDQESRLTVRLSGEADAAPIEAPFPWDVLLLPQLGYQVSGEKVVLGQVRPWEMPEG